MKKQIIQILLLFATATLSAQVVLPAYQGTHYQKATNCGTVTDYDGNVYQTVIIGNQCWMAENLRYLPSVVGPGTGSFSVPCYYVYDYYSTNVIVAKTTANYNTYGVLYNWAAAMAGETSSNSNPSGVQGICPDGWHLPSDAEWTELTDYLGGNIIAGGKLKETGTIHWDAPNEGATNETNFTALGAGYRVSSGSFDRIGKNGVYWTATEGDVNNALLLELYFLSSSAIRGDREKRRGYSIRCIKN